jgi:lysophospholipase L1-like esterase
MTCRLGPRAALWASVALGAAAAAWTPAASATEPVPTGPPGQHWIATWTASPHRMIAFLPNGSLTTPLLGQTVRQRVHISIGGGSFRIRFSNEFGSGPLVIGAASIALPDREAAVQADSIRQLTFGGATSIVVPAGAPALSDPIVLTAPDDGDLIVSLYLPGPTRVETMHATGEQTGYISRPGNFTASPDMPVGSTTQSRLFLSEVDVVTEPSVGVIAAFGDSITDGAASTSGANHRWPDFLSDRLHAAAQGRPAPAVVNEGISGNQLLRDLMGVSALARFDRDVLSVPGVREVIVLIGINDIGTPGSRFGSGPPIEAAAEEPSFATLIAGYRQLIERAHAHGLRIFGATLTPFEGAANGYYTPAKNSLRQAVNQWIRSGEFDGVLDFDAATRDHLHPGRMRASYDSGDHLHPNDAGYRAMASGIDLALFR